MATQDRGKFLVPSEPSPEPPAAAHDEQEPVNPVRPAGFMGEGYPERCEVNLGMLAGACLETHLAFHGWPGADGAEMGHQGMVAPLITPSLISLNRRCPDNWGSAPAGSRDNPCREPACPALVPVACIGVPSGRSSNPWQRYAGCIRYGVQWFRPTFPLASTDEHPYSPPMLASQNLLCSNL